MDINDFANQILPLESQWSMRVFSDQVQKMSEEQLREHLNLCYKSLLIREKYYKEIIKEAWLGK